MIDRIATTRSRPLLFVAIAGVVAIAGLASGCKDGAKRLLGGSPCASGETANEDPKLCYRVPAGMTQKGDPIRRPGHFQVAYQGDGGLKVSFLARELGTFDSTWKALQANAAGSKASDAKEEELDGGKARILTYSTPGKNGRSIISLVRKGSTHVLECEAEASKGTPTEDLVAACKGMSQP